jgi:2-polyprenyl-3-methyl-5-hydroxy-6-metoxy-1,4-benzoquinol methylase
VDVDPRWYEGFFDTDWLRLTVGSIDDERTEREVDFVVERLELEPGARLLDLACGHGRHAIPLARRGLDVVGLDLSEPSLELARERAAAAGADVAWIHADMRDLAFEDEFDAVINMFTAFGYLASQEEDEAVLRAVARALRPDGGFLLETIHAAGLLARFAERDWRELDDGVILLEDRRHDPITGRNEVAWTFVHPDGTRREQRHSLRLYTFPELAAMAARAGLVVEGGWDSVTGGRLERESFRMALVARKPAAA